MVGCREGKSLGLYFEGGRGPRSSAGVKKRRKGSKKIGPGRQTTLGPLKNEEKRQMSQRCILEGSQRADIGGPTVSIPVMGK